MTVLEIRDITIEEARSIHYKRHLRYHNRERAKAVLPQLDMKPATPTEGKCFACKQQKTLVMEKDKLRIIKKKMSCYTQGTHEVKQTIRARYCIECGTAEAP